MINDKTIKSMLEKTDPFPFCFGGAGMFIVWKVAEIDDEIFAEGAYTDTKTFTTVEVFYNLAATNEEGREYLYDEIVTDFVVCSTESWLKHNNASLFNTIGGKDDLGLNEILLLFGRSYPEFLNDVMYWYGFNLDAEAILKEAQEKDDEDDYDDYEEDEDEDSDFDDGYFGGDFDE